MMTTSLCASIDYKPLKTMLFILKFGDGDVSNLCRVQNSRVKKIDVSSTFIENTFRPGLTLVSSNDIITIKIDKKIVKNHKKINKQKLFQKIIWAVKWTKGKRTQIMRQKKR